MGIEPIKLELHNAQFLGDLITGTTVPRDLAAVRRCTGCGHESNLLSKAQEAVIACPNCTGDTFRRKFSVRFNTGGKPHFQQVFYGNPYIEDFSGKADIEVKLGTQIGCNRSQTSGGHITEAFRLVLMAKTGFDFPMGELIPDLHLTDTEKAMSPDVCGSYWVISAGKRPPFTSKFWPPERWQAVVSSLPEITFVQVGLDDGKPKSEHFHPKLYGDNVIDMIGQTQDPRSGIRDLFRLVYHADGCCSLVSSLMHIAAGFRKPCVVPAGAREPARFEAYAFHRYIQYQGSMDCEGVDQSGNDRPAMGIYSCWKESALACSNTDQGYPKCLVMIEPHQVANAIKSYYIGGILKEPSEPAKRRTKKKPTFKMVCNAHGFGGGERSAIWIANRMLREGFGVHVVPSRNVNREFGVKLSPHIKLDSPGHHLTQPCDILMWYTNDMTYGLKDKFALLSEVQAEKKIMVLNYRLGDAGELDWTKNWDQYIFLCSDLEAEYKTRVPECKSLVLPPPVDLTPFLEAQHGSRDKTMHIVRIGSQGGNKYPENIKEVVEQIHRIHPETQFTFMGGHPDLEGLDYVDNLKEYSVPVLDVLRRGSVFWYPLPEGYLDNGPRVIMEAMAAGLPVIADNRGGAKDRIAPGTGWLCDSIEEQVKIIIDMQGADQQQTGQAAREHAKAQFDPERWIEAINNA